MYDVIFLTTTKIYIESSKWAKSTIILRMQFAILPWKQILMHHNKLKVVVLQLSK